MRVLVWGAGIIETTLVEKAFCVSLLAGERPRLAMTAAYLLAGELHRAQGDYAQAFRQYQDLFRPFILEKQKAALRMAATFAPRSRLALAFRNQLFRMRRVPWIAKAAANWELSDKIALPDYSSR